jgi:hypothetical protein
MLPTFGLELGIKLKPRMETRAVGSTFVPNFHREPQSVSPARRPDVSCPDLDAIIEENKQLRELVVQLSKIVVRNVLDRK